MYLAIVRKVKGDWVIDKDSYHIFEDYGGNYLVQEIKIAEIRAIQSSEGEALIKERGETMLKITEGSNKGQTVVKIKSRWDTTSHECQACNKNFAGENAALVELANGNTAIICSECADKIK